MFCDAFFLCKAYSEGCHCLCGSLLLLFRASPFYVLQLETVRFSTGEHTVLISKTYGFQLENVKRRHLKTDCLPFENKLLNECPHFAKLLVGAYRIRPKASTWVSWCIRAYAIRPYIGYLRYTQCGKKMCRSSLYLHGNIFIKRHLVGRVDVQSCAQA